MKNYKFSLIKYKTSHSTNNNVTSERINKTETPDKAKTEHNAETESSDDTMERAYYSNQHEYFLVPKTKTKSKIQIETQTQTKTESRLKAIVPFWVCCETFKIDTILKTHMNKHWRENIATTNDYVIKSNFRQIYIRGVNEEFIENKIEVVDYIIDDIKRFKSYKFKVSVSCLHKKRGPVGDQKSIDIHFRTEEYMTKGFRLDLNQGPDYSKKICEGYGYEYKFIDVTVIKLNLEKSKPSLGSFTELSTDLRSKKNNTIY